MKNKIKYNLYIISDDWKKKREEVFLYRWRVCQKCWSTDNLHIHHSTYVRLYKEHIKDLFVLCWYCHINLHEKCWMKDLLRNTKAFIKWVDFRPRKKRNRIPLEERQKNKKLRKELEMPLALESIKKGIKFSQSWVSSLRNWREALELIKKDTYVNTC